MDNRNWRRRRSERDSTKTPLSILSLTTDLKDVAEAVEHQDDDDDDERHEPETEVDENNSKHNVGTSCTDDPQPGPNVCLAYIPMWYHNVTTGKCVQFIYGGCGGSGNRYDTLEQCERVCVRRGRGRGRRPASTFSVHHTSENAGEEQEDQAEPG